MKKNLLFTRCLVACFAVSLSACGLFSQKPAPTTTAQNIPAPAPAKKGGYYLDDGPLDGAAPDVSKIPDAVVRDEPLHRFANKPYTALGKNYVPNVANDRYKERGTATWYGKKYHGQKTSSGEVYDMMGMTAAHKTLPIPSYVRVTNPANGVSVVVRVNDRGPFIGDRVIDLSYVAATKLGIAQAGSGTVDVERVFERDIPPTSTGVPENSNAVVTALPAQPVAVPIAVPINTSAKPAAGAAKPAAVPAAPAPGLYGVPLASEKEGFYVQLGAYGSQDNATAFYNRAAIELANVVPNIQNEPIQMAQRDGLFRIRIGPFESQEQAKALANKISSSFGPAAVVKSR
jgi:rare lipoprotein A